MTLEGELQQAVRSTFRNCAFEASESRDKRLAPKSLGTQSEFQVASLTLNCHSRLHDFMGDADRGTEQKAY